MNFVLACNRAAVDTANIESPDTEEKLCGFEKPRIPKEELRRSDRYVSFDENTRTYRTPTRLLQDNEWPELVDDLEFEGLRLSVERQLARYKYKNLMGYIELGGVKYPLSKIPESLKRFQEITEEFKLCLISNSKGYCQDDFQYKVKEEFNIFAPLLTPEDPRYGEEKQTLFTAYYTPLLRGRTGPDRRFRHSVYQRPSGKLRKKERVQIDFQSALREKSLEIFYAEDLFDLYLLHVQGGGKVLIEEKYGELKSFYISYDGTNNQPWRFISKYMRKKGYIDNLSIEAQRNFLRMNPQKEEEVYSSCPSYVYFKKSDHPPFGSDRVPLSDNRSIATDTNYYRFKGLLSFVKARRPTEDKSKRSSTCRTLPFQDFSRFYLDQDTGGAIKGKARVDLYFGEGTYAELAAYNIKERGDLFFLLLK